MTKTNKHTKGHKNNKSKRSKRYKGGANYYNPVGDADRDSVDDKMQNVLAKFGIENTSDNSQTGWAVGGILGVGAVISILYFTLKK
jgi:trimethylamine:corrinoid methyltransferase-like protein